LVSLKREHLCQLLRFLRRSCEYFITYDGFSAELVSCKGQIGSACFAEKEALIVIGDKEGALPKKSIKVNFMDNRDA
jgi:hypothetical protein